MMEQITLGTIFTVALLGSFGHCVGMCGGFVVAYSAAKIDTHWSRTHQFFVHLLYSLGRTTSYMLLGAMLGFIGQKVSIAPMAKGSLFFFVGVVMVLIGLSLIGKLKFLSSIESSIAQSHLFGKLFRQIIYNRSMISFFVMGLLNGVIPCGLVYFFATAAVVAGSALKGAIVMGVFGVATIPAMMGVGLFSSLIKGTRYRNYVMKIAAIIVMLFGLFTVYKGYIIATNPQIMKQKMETMHQKLKTMMTPASTTKISPSRFQPPKEE